MENESAQLSPTSAGYSIAASVAIVVNTLLVFAKEKYPPLLAAMKAATTHHWITHGLSIVLLFLILGFIFSKLPFAKRMTSRGAAWALTLTTIASGLALVVYFFFE